MKKNIIFIALILLVINHVFAQQRPYNVVFDLTGKDTSEQRAAIRWMNEITGPHKDAKVELVMFAKGLDLVIKDRTKYADDIAKLLENKNVSLKVCAIAMKNQGIDQSQLLPRIEIVPDGIYEVISKQWEGWGYIKVAL